MRRGFVQASGAVLVGLGWLLITGAATAVGGEWLDRLMVGTVVLFLAWLGLALFRVARRSAGATPTSLSRPQAWPRRSDAGLWALAVFNGPLGILMALGGAAWLTEGAGEMTPWALTLTSTGLLLVVAVESMPFRLEAWCRGIFPARVSRLEQTGQLALLLPYAPAVRVRLVLVLGLVGIFGSSLAVAGLTTGNFVWGGLGVLCVGALGYTIWLRVRAPQDGWPNGTPKGLALTPSGLALASAIVSVTVGPHGCGGTMSWAAVQTIMAREEPRGRGRPLPAIIVAGAVPAPAGWPPGTSSLRVDPHVLQCDPVLLYHTLRFYRDNPAAREELGTQAALDRVARGDLR